MKKIVEIKNPTKQDSFSKLVLCNDAVSCKLTYKQNQIIYALQNGWELITSGDSSTVWVAVKNGQFCFSSSLFYKMVNSGYIYQQLCHPFYYILTPLGRKIITKPICLDKYLFKRP